MILAVSALAPRLSEIVDGSHFEGTNCACSRRAPGGHREQRRAPPSRAEGDLCGPSARAANRGLGEARVLREIEDSPSRARSSSPTSTPAVVNDADGYPAVMERAHADVGRPTASSPSPVHPSDDVAEFLARIPGCYLFIGGALATARAACTTAPTSRRRRLRAGLRRRPRAARVRPRSAIEEARGTAQRRLVAVDDHSTRHRGLVGFAPTRVAAGQVDRRRAELSGETFAAPSQHSYHAVSSERARSPSVWS